MRIPFVKHLNLLRTELAALANARAEEVEQSLQAHVLAEQRLSAQVSELRQAHAADVAEVLRTAEKAGQAHTAAVSELTAELASVVAERDELLRAARIAAAANTAVEEAARGAADRLSEQLDRVKKELTAEQKLCRSLRASEAAAKQAAAAARCESSRSVAAMTLEAAQRKGSEALRGAAVREAAQSKSTAAELRVALEQARQALAAAQSVAAVAQSEAKASADTVVDCLLQAEAAERARAAAVRDAERLRVTLALTQPQLISAAAAPPGKLQAVPTGPVLPHMAPSPHGQPRAAAASASTPWQNKPASVSQAKAAPVTEHVSAIHAIRSDLLSWLWDLLAACTLIFTD
jgi:hypothetical protein